LSLVLYQHPFALYCWKVLVALYQRDVPFTSELVELDRSALAALWPPASIPLLVDDGVVVPESSIIVEHLAYATLDRSEHRALAAYFDRLLIRSSVGRVVDEARPYRAVFPLPWPEHVS
jgi:Glutathione S-transferase, N-terminal domain